MLRRLSCIAAVGVLGLTTSCQEHEMDYVPEVTGNTGHWELTVAQPVALDVMLVVDSSGSMADGVGPASGKSKWEDLKTALLDPATGFIARNRDNARFGLMTFPSGPACEPGQFRVPLDARDNLDPIAVELDAIKPQGGTPTTLTLAKLDDVSFPEILGRKRLVVLLTDGLPNCNDAENNVLRCEQCNADAAACTAPGGCNATFGDPNSCDAFSAPAGTACLDDQNAVAQIEALRTQGIDTVILAFGSEMSTPLAVKLLDEAAVAGGWARAAERKFFQANDGAELKRAFDELLHPALCNYELERPIEDALVSVVLARPGTQEEITLQRDVDWALDGQNIKLLDARCAQVESLAGYKMEVRWFSKL